MSALRAVLDTNILVSAFLSPSGKPAKIYRVFLAGTLDFVINAEIIAEYDDVLHRPRLRLPLTDVEVALSAIKQYAITIATESSTFAMPDEDDRVFYDTAKTANAYLITGNVKHYPQEAFILTPAEFLALGVIR